MNNIDNEYEQFEDSILYLSGSEERDARLSFGKKLKSLIGQHPNSANLYHKLGLCLYGLDSWGIEEKKTIEISFHRAMLLDKGSIFSKIFLIHFYFDIAEFNLSLNLNSFIDSSADRAGIVPAWRLVKLLQIKLSCKIYLSLLAQEELEKELINMLSRYEGLDIDDLVAAEPTELGQALVRSSSEYNLIQMKESLNKIKGLCEIAEKEK